MTDAEKFTVNSRNGITCKSTPSLDLHQTEERDNLSGQLHVDVGSSIIPEQGLIAARTVQRLRELPDYQDVVNPAGISTLMGAHSTLLTLEAGGPTHSQSPS